MNTSGGRIVITSARSSTIKETSNLCRKLLQVADIPSNVIEIGMHAIAGSVDGSIPTVSYEVRCS
jgi:hypothetical protein